MVTTFVINLDKDKERLSFMDSQLAASGLSYRRQPAILGKEYQATRAEYDEDAAVRATGHALIPGEIGCALSHVAVYKAIVAESIPFALIFEDDVEIPRHFKDIVERMVQAQPTIKFDYLLFDYVAVGIPFIRQWFRSVVINTRARFQQSVLSALLCVLYAFIKMWYIVPMALFEGFRNWYKQSSPGPVKFYRPVYFAGAYLVTLEGVKKLLALAQPVVYTADQLPNQARIKSGLRFYCYAPRVVEQQKKVFGSSILDITGDQII